MFGIGQPELIIILFIVLLVFGPSKLPKLSKTLGESAAALKDGFTGGKNDKSFKDITEEVTSSAKEIKKGITEFKTTTGPTAPQPPPEQPTPPAPQPPPTPPVSQPSSLGGIFRKG